MSTAALPPLDEHTTTIAADPDDVWSALLDTVDGAFLRPGATLYARLVGCEPATTSGRRPLGEGATVPGFRVVVAAPSRLLVLEGHHRFSSYTLTFGLEHGGTGPTVLRAESRAQFPGVAGRAYRLLVVSSGGHVFAVRHLLSAVRHRAEERARSRTAHAQ